MNVLMIGDIVGPGAVAYFITTSGSSEGLLRQDDGRNTSWSSTLRAARRSGA